MKWDYGVYGMAGLLFYWNSDNNWIYAPKGSPVIQISRHGIESMALKLKPLKRNMENK